MIARSFVSNSLHVSLSVVNAGGPSTFNSALTLGDRPTWSAVVVSCAKAVVIGVACIEVVNGHDERVGEWVAEAGFEAEEDRGRWWWWWCCGGKALVGVAFPSSKRGEAKLRTGLANKSRSRDEASTLVARARFRLGGRSLSIRLQLKTVQMRKKQK